MNNLFLSFSLRNTSMFNALESVYFEMEYEPMLGLKKA